MSKTRHLPALLAATALLLSGCGGGSEEVSPSPTATAPAPTSPAPTPPAPPPASAATPLPDVVTLSAPSHVEPGQATSLTSNLGGGVAGLRYTWDSGNGTTATGAHVPAQTYGRDGAYEVKLTVSNEIGATRSASAQVLVGQLGSIGTVLGCTKASQRGWCHRSASVRDISFLDANTGWAAGDNTVYRTDDGGTTWQPNSLDRAIQPMLLKFFDANNGWMLASDPARGSPGTGNFTMLHTTDGGRRWTTQNLAPDTDLGSGPRALWTLDGQRVILSAARGTRATRDGGATWTVGLFPIATMAPGGQLWSIGSTGSLLALDELGTAVVREISLEGKVEAVSFADARNGWAHARVPTGVGTTEANAIYRTIDGGATWTSTNATGLATNSDPVRSLFSFHGTTGWLGVNSKDGPFGATRPRQYRSTDGGVTWSTLTLPSTATLASALSATTATASGTLTRDGGATWQTYPSMSRLVVPAPDRVFMTNVSSVSWSRTVGAGAIEPVFSSLGPTFAAVHPFDASHWLSVQGAWLVADAVGSPVNTSATIRDTTNAGRDWSAATTFNTVRRPTAARFQFTTPTTGWLINGPTLLKTTDAGKTWESKTTPFLVPEVITVVQKDIDFRNPRLALLSSTLDRSSALSTSSARRRAASG